MHVCVCVCACVCADDGEEDPQRVLAQAQALRVKADQMQARVSAAEDELFTNANALDNRSP